MQEVTLVYVVTVQLARQSGPFAPLEDLAEVVQDALDGADPGEVDAGDSSYTVANWDVARQEQPRKLRRPRLSKAQVAAAKVALQAQHARAGS